jgi:hypothetical protein
MICADGGKNLEIFCETDDHNDLKWNNLMKAADLSAGYGFSIDDFETVDWFWQYQQYQNYENYK